MAAEEIQMESNKEKVKFSKRTTMVFKFNDSEDYHPSYVAIPGEQPYTVSLRQITVVLQKGYIPFMEIAFVNDEGYFDEVTHENIKALFGELENKGVFTQPWENPVRLGPEVSDFKHVRKMNFYHKPGVDMTDAGTMKFVEVMNLLKASVDETTGWPWPIITQETFVVDPSGNLMTLGEHKARQHYGAMYSYIREPI